MLKTIPRWEALNTGLLGASGAEQDKAEMQTSTTATENCHKSLESQWASVSPVRIKMNLQDFDESDLVLDVPPIMLLLRNQNHLEASNIRVWMKGYT